jgi:hypothetical protein
MLIKIGLENDFEGRSLAWLLDFPGCFAYGPDETTALMSVPRRLLEYRDWIGRRTADSWLADLGDFDMRLVETFHCYTIDENYNDAEEGYDVGAWFRHDWKPLSVIETRRAAQMLEWSRQDLMQIINGLSREEMEKNYEGERWSVLGILSHVAGAEWWYMDRLNLSGMTRAQLPRVPFERLELVRNKMLAVLPELAGEEKVVGVQGELWSPRKILRRALWHERDHIEHILKLLLR